jgi:hypothetical protein
MNNHGRKSTSNLPLKITYLPSAFRFENVSNAASKEHALEQSISKMMSEWDNTKLNTIGYK